MKRSRTGGEAYAIETTACSFFAEPWIESSPQRFDVLLNGDGSKSIVME